MRPPANCSVGLKADDLDEWEALLVGPDDTPYAKGLFFLDITFPPTYPSRPPTVKFRTKIYHCNISGSGCICLDFLKCDDNWTSDVSMSTVLLSIAALLQLPNPDDPFNSEAADQYDKDRAEHDRRAREWTETFARI